MKIVFCGLGSIGQRHLRIVKERFPAAEIFTFRHSKRNLIVNDDLSTVEADPVQEYGLMEVKNLSEAAKIKPDVVFITNPTSLHIKTARAFLRDGCHLFIEKPLGHELKEALAFQKAAKKIKAVIYLGYQFQFHPYFLKIQEQLKQKSIGNICSAIFEVGEYAVTQHRYEDYRTTYLASKKLGGGVVLSQSHEVDMLLRLFGRPRSVFASGGRRSRLQMNVEDCVDAVLDYPKFSAVLHMDYLQFPKTRQLKIVGDRGAVHLDLLAQSLKLSFTESEQIQDEKIQNFVRTSLFRAEHDLFFQKIDNKEFDREDLRMGLEGLNLIAAIKKSAQTKKVVMLPKVKV